MSFKIKGSAGVDAEVETTRALRVTPLNRGPGYAVSTLTGTMTAGLGLDSTIFAMRLNPTATVVAYIERVRITYVTITGLTAANLASRRLEVRRASAAAASGGTAIATVPAKDSTSATSQFNSANGGDVRVATTGALTVGGISFETVPLLTNEGCVNAGTAGQWSGVMEWRQPPGEVSPFVLNAGELLVVRNALAWDAAGTWQALFTVEWSETTKPV